MDTRQQNLQTSHVSATKRKVDIRQRNSLQIKLQFKHPICKKRWFADALGLKFGPASNPILDWDSKRQKKNTKCRWRESGCVPSRRESCSSGSFGHLRPPSIGPDLTCRRSVRLNSLAVRSTLWAFWSFCCIPVFVGSLSWWGGHWLQSAVAMRGCTRSATVSRWVVWIKWHPHARHDQQRASVPGEDCTLWTVQQVTLHTLWVQHWANTVTKSESSSLWLVFVL